MKIYDMLRRRGRDMKIFYGEFCINFKKSNYIIAQHQDFVSRLEKLADKDNRCSNQLSELFQKWGKMHINSYHDNTMLKSGSRFV